MWDLWLQLLESLETVCSGDKSLAGTLDHIYGSFLETIALFHCFKSARLLSPGVVESQKKYITCSSLPHVGVPHGHRSQAIWLFFWGSRLPGPRNSCFL